VAQGFREIFGIGGLPLLSLLESIMSRVPLLLRRRQVDAHKKTPETESVIPIPLLGAALAGIYMVGYTIETFYFSSIGIALTGYDAFKLRYIYIGLHYCLIASMLTMPIYFAFRIFNDEIYNKKSASRLLFYTLMAFNAYVIVYQSEITSLLDTHSRNEWIKISTSVVLLFCIFIGARMIELERGKEFYSWHVSLGLILALLIIDLIFIFPGFLNVAILNPLAYVLFGLSVLALSGNVIMTMRRLGRLKEELNRRAFARERNAMLIYSGVISASLVALSVSIYSITIFPHIRNSVGGSSHRFSRAARIFLKETSDSMQNRSKADSDNKLKPFMSNAIVIYSSDTAYFVIEMSDNDNPCTWNLLSDRHFMGVIHEIRKENIGRIEYLLPRDNCSPRENHT
jgi:hypothetical protein